ncbi:MAG TPA: hypothetical protein VI546_04005, partial [candidate division Zixibacteria bacterium]|nr:hypothetical protein [candidate division Zixibacteria bacterium]
MRKQIIVVLLSVLCLFLISSALPGRKGKVKKVLDGDTIVLENGEKIRYLCIDSPEEGEPFYDEANRVNDSLVLEKSVRVEFDRKVK